MSAADAYTFPFNLLVANPLPRPTYASWAGQQVAHGRLSDLPLFAKEIREAAYWAARDVTTR